MLNETQQAALQQLTSGAGKETLTWLAGYFTALAGSPLASATEPAPAAPAAATRKLTITYGTETGNAKKLATAFAARARKQGVQARLLSLEQYKVQELQKEEAFLTVISTQGEGEPPAAAKKFWDYLHQSEGSLNGLHYSVLALGDTSYPLFCKAGEVVDQRLKVLGGHPLHPIERCDTDYEGPASAWFEAVLQKLQTGGRAAAATVAPSTPSLTKPAGKKWYSGTILTNTNLNDRGSLRQTHHIELSAEGATYAPGDALGLIPLNPPAAVADLLQRSGGDTTVVYRGETLPLSSLLSERVQILHLPARVVRAYAERTGQDIPDTRMNLSELLYLYPPPPSLETAAVWELLEPIAPRLYSISSSPEAHSGEIHLTVARETFTVDGAQRFGHCSDFLCTLEAGTAVRFYIHPNHRFRPPAPERDCLMIGPGTGIAPFRSFLHQREATGASGRNWLFFGAPHLATDFLYQTEVLSWLETGHLQELSVAFSRDRAEKVYVQHRLLERAGEVWKWIEGGAHLYVCGSKDPMSRDVEAALRTIAQTAGGLSENAAHQWLEALAEEGRYLTDVY